MHMCMYECMYVYVCHAYVYVMILIFGCSCMHLFALPPLHLLPLLLLLLLFTICFLLNCSFVLTCKFWNFHHSFSFTFTTIFAVFCRPPFVACNMRLAPASSAAPGLVYSRHLFAYQNA